MAYRLQTNFKDVERQVSRDISYRDPRTLTYHNSQLAQLEDRSTAACIIRGQINAVDDHVKSRTDPAESESPELAWQFHHVYLGSRQPATTVGALAAATDSDPAFHNFRVKLATCMQKLMAREALTSQNAAGLITGSVVVQDSDAVGLQTI
jgi:hypothetical protein